MWYISAKGILFEFQSLSLLWRGAGYIIGLSCYTTSYGNRLDPSNEIRCMQIVNLAIYAKQSDKLGRHGPLLQVYTAKPPVSGTNTLGVTFQDVYQRSVVVLGSLEDRKTYATRSAILTLSLKKWLTGFPKDFKKKSFFALVF